MATNFSLMIQRGFYFAAEYDPATNGSRYLPQHFPYVINRDIYGCKLIPENLGYYSPIGSSTPRLPADMIRVARKNLVVRDGWANAYFHGYLPLTNLQAIVTGIKALGYAYVQLSPGSPSLLAAVTLTNLTQTFDGVGKCVSAATAPAGLAVNLTYDGSPSCPTNVGTYTVIGNIGDTNYTGSATNTLTIGKATAPVNLGNLSPTYTGGAITVTASTVPSNLVVNLTYNGSATAPTNAGSYTVVGTISDANYQGGATNSLVISKATAPVNLTGLTQTYDGAGKCVAAATTPAGLVVNLTYNVFSACPTNAGSYTAVGSVSDANYQGGTTNTLTIGKAVATVNLANLARTYTGGAIAASATTAPPGLPVNLTYNGSATAPTNAGSYTVIATISAANHQGGDTNTLVIAAAAATVTLADLGQTFDGTGKCVSATTAPAGLVVNLTYDGSPACPTNAGTHTVIGTIADNNYQGSATNTLTIGKATALVNLGNLSQTYTGGAMAVAASTVPSNLVVNLTYNGSIVPPTNAGSYTVIGTVSDANYQGGTTNTFIIGKATATITLTNLAQTYTGNPITVAALTTPSGLTVSFAYDGSATAPTNVGDFAVIGTIADDNYQGSATNTLTIGKATALVNLDNLSQTYTGGAITVAANTVPSNLVVNLTYDGSAVPPTNAGSYTVIGTVSDANYLGGATNTLVVGLAGAAVNLGDLIQTYDGTGKCASAQTTPSGLLVNQTYDGSSSCPTNPGSYTVIGTISDANHQGGATNTLVINCPIIALSGLTNANLGVAYSQSISATGGAAPYLFTLTSGSMPAGLSLGTNGNIGGLPLAPATNSLTVTATDANGCSGSQTYTFKVTGSGPAADTNKPTVLIISPATSSTVTNASLIVSGSASDSSGKTNSGVALVFLSLNDGPQQLATGRTNWTAAVTLMPGTNTIIAQAVDYRGNISKPATNRFFYALRSVFT
ncbi:MAG: MBG domain-containing protein, partial [Verrucomicrobia bacterium]|nr:MBG domain-containing protein [Verrucomicrobiota bacterium]